MANPENDHNKVTFTFEPIPHDFKHETCSRRKEMFFKWYVPVRNDRTQSSK